MELFWLAKKLGVDACVDACRAAIANSKDAEPPIVLRPCDDDFRRQRKQLRRLHDDSDFQDKPTAGEEYFGHVFCDDFGFPATAYAAVDRRPKGAAAGPR